MKSYYFSNIVINTLNFILRDRSMFKFWILKNVAYSISEYFSNFKILLLTKVWENSIWILNAKKNEVY